MRAFVAAEHLVKKIEKDYKEDIALVVMMGSHLYHDTHEKSDIDLYFIPKTDRGFNLSMVFTIDGIGYDFWPITWERLEKIANWNERIVSIVTEGKILFVSNDDDLKRFNDLKLHAYDPGFLLTLRQKAKDKFKEAYQINFDLCHAEDLTSVRKYGIKLLYLLTEVVALYNQTPIKRGRGKLKSEIAQMKVVPKGFLDHYDDIFISKDLKYIKKSFYEMIVIFENFFNQDESKEIKSFKNQAEGFYEEIINNYNKIERACMTQDYYTALFSAAEIEFEYEWLFKDVDVKNELPDLLCHYHHHDLSHFYEHVKKHQKAFVKLLSDHQVSIKTFKDMNELKKELDSL